MSLPNFRFSYWHARAWYTVVCVAGLAVFTVLFAMTGEAGLSMLIGSGTGLVLLLFGQLQEPGTPDGNA